MDASNDAVEVRTGSGDSGALDAPGVGPADGATTMDGEDGVIHGPRDTANDAQESADVAPPDVAGDELMSPSDGPSTSDSPTASDGPTAGDGATTSSALCPTVPALTAIEPVAPAKMTVLADLNTESDAYALLQEPGSPQLPLGGEWLTWSTSSQSFVVGFRTFNGTLTKEMPQGSGAIGQDSTGTVFCAGGICQELAAQGFVTNIGFNSVPEDVNDNGTVVGYMYLISSDIHPFKWTPTAPSPGEFVFDLGTLGGTAASAVAVNASNVVVGSSFTSTNTLQTEHAFLYDTAMHDLGTLGGTYSSAVAISSNGDVVGESTTSAGPKHAFLWHAGTMQDLGTLGGTTSTALAVNASSQVVGNSTTSSGQTHLFFWSAGVMQDLGTLGGPGIGLGRRPLNDAGQVVGTSENAAGWLHAFIWQLGVMRDLGTLGGTPVNGPPTPPSSAVAISATGRVAGNSFNASNQARAFFVDPGACTLP